jgi:TRAP-type mannitol/chloroaromatic compound transport system permease small subunit
MFFCGFAYILKHGENVRWIFCMLIESKNSSLVDFIGIFLSPFFCILGWYVTIDPVLDSWGYMPGGTGDLGRCRRMLIVYPCMIKSTILFALYLALFAQILLRPLENVRLILKAMEPRAEILMPDMEITAGMGHGTMEV